MKNIILLSCVVFSFFAFTTKASAATYYVDLNSVTGCNGLSTGTAWTYSNEILTDGGMNIWTNTTTLTNWTTSKAGTSALAQESNPAFVYSGSSSAKFTLDASVSSIFIYQNSAVVSGHTYLLTFWNLGTTSFNMQAGYRGATFHAVGGAIAVTTTWTYRSVTFTATENGRLEISRYLGSGASQSFWVDDVSLKEEFKTCAWPTVASITGLAAGDSVLFKKGEVFRTPLTVSASGTAGYPITYGPYGSGANPVFTGLTNYSASAGYSWVDAGVGNSSIIKLTGNAIYPLLAPWGVANGGHSELNLLTNGSWETWSSGRPTGWTTSTAGTSAVTQVTGANAWTGDGGTNSISLVIDASGSAASISQSLTLAANTNYVLRFAHKETGGAVPTVQLRKTSGTVQYWDWASATWQIGQTNISLTTRATYYDSWLYFQTPSDVAGTYEILISNGAGSASKILYFDQSVVILKSELNNNFQVATASSTAWATNGFSALQNREIGLSASSLSAGYWWWQDEVLYYHLASDETDANNLHIEVSQGSWASGPNGILSSSKSYVTMENLEVAYFGKYLISMSGNNHFIFQNIYAHHGDVAYQISSGDTYYFYNTIGSHGFEYAYYDQNSTNSRYWNCIAYGSQTNNGFNMYTDVAGVSIKNFISTGNHEYDFYNNLIGTFTQGINDHLLWSGSVYGNGVWNGTVADPLFYNLTNGDFSLTYLSPAIDAGTDVGLTTDFTGTNPIYGIPDIGAYEYQPPHSLIIATPDAIDAGAGARIYQDGKFRDLGVINSNPAHLTIIPTGGFTTYVGTTTRPAWMDITNITWVNDTNRHKAWTASSTVGGLTNIIHTVGDLEANKYYDVKLDNVLGQNITGGNCTNGICLSNAQGEITFTYTGTYSTHTFDVTEGDNTGPTGTISNGNGTPSNTTTPTFNLTIADAGIGISGASMRFSCNNSTWSSWESYATPKTNFNVNTGEGCVNSDGSKTVYVQFKDSLGNIGSAYNTGAFTLDTSASFAALSGTPTSVTSSTVTSVTVAGTNIISYKYKLDSGSYGDETLIAIPIALSGLTDGSHTISVIGKNSAGTWQEQGSATTYSWTVDATAPVVTFSTPATATSLTLTFTSFTATDTNGVSGYLVNETMTTPAIDDSGWSGTAQTEYVFSSAGAKTLYAWAKDGIGNISTSTNSNITITLPSNNIGGAGCLNCFVIPSTPVGGFSVSINQDAIRTTNSVVTLSFNANADIKRVAISLDKDFTGASQENYSPTKKFDLCSKSGGLIKSQACLDGKYTVYTKFYNAAGNASPTVMTSIILKTSAVNVVKYNFARNLFINIVGTDVKILQQFLNARGFLIAKTGAGSPGKETTRFGALTRKALAKFQEFVGLPDTGFFGPMTREYINKQ